jgi:predicted nucleotidyltransferase
MQEQLESILDRKVDFLTSSFLSAHFREQTLEQAQTIYERR